MTVMEGTAAGKQLAVLKAKRNVDRPVSLVIVAGVLRAADLLLIAAAAILTHALYLSHTPFADHRLYLVAVLLGLFATGTVFHANGLYQLQGLTAGSLKLGKLAASWGVVMLG